MQIEFVFLLQQSARSDGATLGSNVPSYNFIRGELQGVAISRVPIVDIRCSRRSSVLLFTNQTLAGSGPRSMKVIALIDVML